MVTRSQKVRLGIFLIVSTVLLITLILIITGSRLLKRRDMYFIRYKEISLSGLEIGSAVKYRGIRVGRIDDIFIDTEDITSIIVQISVEPKVPIKEDTEAIINLIGITGLKMIELQGGTNESKRLPPDSFIRAGQSLVDMISGRADVITQKMELILNNLGELTEATHREQLYRLIENTSNTLESFQTLLDTNQISLFHSVQNFERITEHLDTLITSSQFVIDDIRNVTGSPQLQTTVDNFSKISTELKDANLSDVIQKLAAAIEQTNKTFTHLDLTILKSRHDILSSTEILRESLEYFNEFTRLISENPSLLLRSTHQEEIQE